MTVKRTRARAVFLAAIAVLSMVVTGMAGATFVTNNGAPSASPSPGATDVLTMDLTLSSGDVVIIDSGLSIGDGVTALPVSSNEFYVDVDGDGAYDTANSTEAAGTNDLSSDETIVNSSTGTDDNLFQDGEVEHSEGLVDPHQFSSNDRFVDAGSSNNNNYDDGELIVNSSDAELDASDDLVTSGDANLTNFVNADNVYIAESDGDGVYEPGNGEFLFVDEFTPNGVTGAYNSTATVIANGDTVIANTSASTGMASNQSATTQITSDDRLFYLDLDNDGSYTLSVGTDGDAIVNRTSANTLSDDADVPNTAQIAKAANSAGAGWDAIGGNYDEGGEFLGLRTSNAMYLEPDSDGYQGGDDEDGDGTEDVVERDLTSGTVITDGSQTIAGNDLTGTVIASTWDNYATTTGTTDGGFASGESLIEDNDADDGTTEGGTLNADVTSVYGDELVDLAVNNTGSLAASEISSVTLYNEDGSTAGFQSGEDTQLSSVSSQSALNQWEFTAINELFGNETTDNAELRIYVAVDLASDATTTDDLQFQVPGPDDDNGNGAFDQGSDTGLFVESAADTGGITNANTQTVSASDIPGDDNSQVDTSIGGAASENISAGSATQTLGLVRVKDVSGGSGVLGDHTTLRMPAGVTVNASATSLTVTTSDTGGLDVDGRSISSDGKRIRIEHTNTSNDGEVLRIGGIVVDTTSDVAASRNGTRINVTVDYALGSLESRLLQMRRAGLSVDGNQPAAVGAGSNGVAVFDKTLNLSFDRAGGQIAAGTDVRLYPNTSNGITWDESVSGETIVHASPTRVSLDVENITVEADVITIPVNGSSHQNGGNVTFQNLRVNVSGTATDSLFSAEVRANDSTGVVAVEQEGSLPVVDVRKPAVYLDRSGDAAMGHNLSRSQDRNVSVGRLQQDLVWNVSVNATTDSDIQEGHNITLSFNNSAVTFDRSAADRDLIDATAFDKSGDANDGVAGVEIADDGSSLTVNVTGDGLEQDDNVSFSGIRLNVTNAPANGTQIGINLTTGANQDVINQSKHQLTAIRPNATFNGGSNYTLKIGDTGNRSASVNAGELDLYWSEDDPQALAPRTTNITITLESGTGVTFNQSLNGSKTTGPSGGLSATPRLNASNRTDPGQNRVITRIDNSNVSATIVNSKTIALVLHNGSRWIDDSSVQAVNVSNVWLNATGDAQNTSVTFSVNTTGVEDTAGEVTIVQDQPTVGHINNSQNVSVTLDDDPPNQPAVVNWTLASGSQGDFNLSFGVKDDIPSQAFNVTLSIPENSGIAFRDVPLNAGTNISGATVTRTDVVDDRTINLTVNNPNPATSGEHGKINVNGSGVASSGIELNVTESAVNTTLTVSLNRSPSGTTDRITDKGVVEFVLMDRVSPNEIDFDGDSQGGFGDNSNTTNVDDQPEMFLRVNHSGNAPFSGADVSVSIEDNDNGASIVSQPGPTFQNGTAKFRVDPGTATNVTYNVTATLDSDPSVNQTMTLTVQPGAPTQITAAHHKNAVEFNTTTAAEPNQAVERAAITVTLRDQFDNLVTNRQVTVDNIALNRSGTVVGGANNTTAVRLDKGMMAFNGSSGTVNTTSDGAFYIVIGAGEGTKTFSVTVDISQPVSDSVEATTTVYSQVDQVTVGAANRSEPLIRDTNVEMPVTLLDENGNAIRVANQSVRKTSSNGTVLTRRGASQVTTNASGMVTARYAVGQDGTAKVRTTAVRDNVLGTKAFTAVDPTLEITSVSPSSIEALTETDVNVTVTYAHNGSVVGGASVSLEGSGVDTSATTGADGVAHFTNVNATDASVDVAVSASKSVRQGINDATNATITVTQKTLTEVALNITANRTEIVTDETVLFTVTRDDTGAVVDATVTIDGTDYSTGSDGTVNVTFTSAGTVTATASKADTSEETFTDDSVDVSVYAATVTFDDVTVENGTTSVTVDSAEYTGGAYFVAIHNSSAGSPGPIIGTSSEQASGANSGITVSLDEALVNNVTLTAMLHESDAGSRGAAITRNGAAVTDSASVTVSAQVGDGDDIPSTYEDENGQVQTDGLRTAINHWATGTITTSLLRKIINEWAVGG